MKRGINVPLMLGQIPAFKGFLTVRHLDELVRRLPRRSTPVRVETCGESGQGAPIYHVKIGSGRIKALIVGFPHCKEPIGGLTVATLLSWAIRDPSALADTDIEWHIVPCIDPDGTKMNENWMRLGFSLDRYMRHQFVQLPRNQVDMSFPVRYKRIHWNRPSKEARVLKDLIDRVEPDFYFPLHNGYTGGVWYGITRDIFRGCYSDLHRLLRHYRVRLQTAPPFRHFLHEFAKGVWEIFTIPGFYDHLERAGASPERALRSFGAASWEYLGTVKPSAFTFVAEVPYVNHPLDGSAKRTGESRRHLKLRLDCENKYLASVIFEEWENVKHHVNTKSPFYDIVLESIINARDCLPDSLPISTSSLSDIVFNKQYSGEITEGERIETYLFDRWAFLFKSYGFVRLLKSSKKSRAISRATRRLEVIFHAAMDDVREQVQNDKFERIEYRTLAAVQLGSALIVLNWMLRKDGW